MQILKTIPIILVIIVFIAGLTGVYIIDERRERLKWEGKFYSDVDIHDVVSTDLAPSIDFKQVKTIVEGESGDTAIGTKRCFYRLAPYIIRWSYALNFWQANLYVPVGIGEAVKYKLESLDFVDGVIIRNSTLYEHPKDDRLEIELSKRANKSHTERLDAMLPGIMEAVREGL